MGRARRFSWRMATKKQPSGDAAFEQFKAELDAALEEGERDIRAGRVHTLEEVERSSAELLETLRKRRKELKRRRA